MYSKESRFRFTLEFLAKNWIGGVHGSGSYPCPTLYYVYRCGQKDGRYVVWSRGCQFTRSRNLGSSFLIISLKSSFCELLSLTMIAVAFLVPKFGEGLEVLLERLLVDVAGAGAGRGARARRRRGSRCRSVSRRRFRLRHFPSTCVEYLDQKRGLWFILW